MTVLLKIDASSSDKEFIDYNEERFQNFNFLFVVFPPQSATITTHKSR
jgi:hypothetical protein